MGAHVFKSTAAPVAAPTADQLGSHWIKTTDPVGHWLAIGTTDVGDWLDLLTIGSGGGVTSLPQLSDVSDTATSGGDEGDVLTLVSGVWTSAAPTGGSGGSSFLAQGVGIAVQVDGNTFDNTIVPLAGYTNSMSNPTTNTYPEMWPIVIGADMTVSTIGLQLAASSGTPVTIQLALYESDPATGLPTDKLAEKNRSVVSSTDASMTLDTPVAVTAGLYWICTWASASTALKGVESIDALAFGLFNELTLNDEMPTLGAFPTPFNMANADTWGNGQVPVFSVY